MTLAWRKPPLHRSSGGCAIPDANTGREVNSYVGLARRIHVRNQNAKPGRNHATGDALVVSRSVGAASRKKTPFAVLPLGQIDR